MAEGILQHKADKLKLGWQVDSCGTANYHVGETPHVSTQKICKLNGIDVSKHLGRQFVKEDMLTYDKIYVMDEDNYNDVKRMSRDLWNEAKTDLILNEMYASENRDVPDPWYGTEKDFHEVFAMLDKACDKIIGKYADVQISK